MRGGATDHQGRLNPAFGVQCLGHRAIPQIQHGSLSDQCFVVPLQQDPTGDTSNNQNARCDEEQCALFAEFMGIFGTQKSRYSRGCKTLDDRATFQLGRVASFEMQFSSERPRLDIRCARDLETP